MTDCSGSSHDSFKRMDDQGVKVVSGVLDKDFSKIPLQEHNQELTLMY